MKNYNISIFILVLLFPLFSWAQQHENHHLVSKILIEEHPEESKTLVYNSKGICVEMNSMVEKISIHYTPEGKLDHIHRTIKDSVEINRSYQFDEDMHWQWTRYDYPDGSMDSTKRLFLIDNNNDVMAGHYFEKQGNEWEIVDKLSYHWENGNLRKIISEQFGEIHFDYGEGTSPYSQYAFAGYLDNHLHYQSKNLWTKFKHKPLDGQTSEMVYKYVLDKDNYPISRKEMDVNTKEVKRIVYEYVR